MSSGALFSGAPNAERFELLRQAAAFVYVDDLAAPAPDPDDAHHLLNVLRLRAGEVVVAGDGRGGYVTCTLAQVSNTGRRGRGGGEPLDALLVASGALEHAPGPTTEICVGFALAKGDRAEWTVQKLTEIGVDRIVPLLTERTIVRLDGADAVRRGERFRRIAREAGAQSRRLHLPVVEDPIALTAFVAALPDGVGVALAEPGGGPFDDAIGTVLIGPEGGWSEGELARIQGRIGLGNQVLRAETAALVAGTLLIARRDRIG